MDGHMGILNKTEVNCWFFLGERVKCGTLLWRSCSELNVDGADIRLFDLLLSASAAPHRYLGSSTYLDHQLDQSLFDYFIIRIGGTTPLPWH